MTKESNLQKYRLFEHPGVEDVYLSFPPVARQKCLQLRELIFRVADRTLGAGQMAEGLRWGEPSFLISKKSGTTLRVAWKKKTPEQYGLYVPCQTNLIEVYRSLYADSLQFEGKRAIVFDLQGVLPKAPIRHCIELALTYYQK